MQINFFLLIILAACVPLLNFILVKQLIYLSMMLALFLSIPVSFLILRKGYKPAKFLFIGILFLSPASLYYLITEFGFLPASEVGDKGYLVASIFLIWFFSQAVSERIHLFRSDKEKAESELYKSEEQLSLVIKGADLGTWDWDIQNNKIAHNERWAEMLGFTLEEVKNNFETWIASIHPDDKEEALKSLNAHLNGEYSSYEAEYRLKHKSGKWIWVLDRGKSIDYDRKGKPSRVTGTIVDITKRKRAEISQQVIFNITNAVSTTKDMHTFYEIIHHQLNKLIEAENFQVGLYDKNRDVVQLPYVIDQKDNYSEFPLGKTCSAYVLKKRKAVIIRQEDEKKLIEKGEIEIIGTPSKIWLGAPLIVNDEILGLIYVQSYENENAYDEKDLALMEFVSEQIAISISHKQAEEAIHENEKRFKTLFNTASDAIFIMKDDHFVDCNEKTLKMFACTREQVIGTSPHNFSPETQPDGRLSKEKALAKINATLAGKTQLFEWKHSRFDGTLFDAEISLNLVELSNEIYIQAIVRDISSRKRSEHLLQVINEVGMAMQNALTTDDIFKKVSAALEQHGLHFTYFTYIEKDDSYYSKFISFSNTLINKAEKLAGIKLEDLAVPKNSAEEFIRVTDKREVVFAKSGKGFLRKMLPAPMNLLAGQIAKILDLQSMILAPLIADDKVEGMVSIQSDELQESYIPAISVLVHQLSNAIKRAQHFEQAQNEISVRLKAEKALINSEEFFRSIIENSNDIVSIMDGSGKLKYQSPSHERVLGYPSGQLIGNSAFERIHPEDQSRIRLQFKNIINNFGKIEPFNTRYQHYNGSWRYIEGTVTNLLNLSGVKGIIINFRDVTEGQLLENQLNQSQKMEAIGQLAGGVAHDFNNLLTVISGYSHLLLMKDDLSGEYKGKLEQIQKASTRAEALTRQLLAFSRKEIVQPKIIDVNAIINDSIKMLIRLIGEDIQIGLKLCDGLPPIMADPHQLEQILINLVVNARDAIQLHTRSTSKKLITIETKYKYLDKQYVHTHTGSNKGPHIEFSVSDSGTGMDKETSKKIFEPFFTTKEQGKGTGLGLSTVYGIVKQNQASINVYSEPGNGTTLRICWPVSESNTEISATKTKPNLQKGNESILFVEDDDDVRTFGEEALKSLGYTIYLANNAEQALNLLKKEKIKPHLLFTDIIMPGMDGKELSRKIKKFLPEISVIYSSGYTDDHIVNKGFLEKGVHFLEKPYSISSLSSKIREVLENN